MWLKMHKQIKRESYSQRKRAKVTMVKGINPNKYPPFPEKNKNKNKKINQAPHIRSHGQLFRPRQHGIAIRPELL